MWKENLNKEFEGFEECPICYYVFYFFIFRLFTQQQEKCQRWPVRHVEKNFTRYVLTNGLMKKIKLNAQLARVSSFDLNYKLLNGI